MSGGGDNPGRDDGRWERQELFISYSQKDRAFLERFWTHLSPLEEDYGLKRWDDSLIQPGEIWLQEIEQALERAKVALLLVSPDFLASEFIRRKELPPLFDAARQGGLTILWLPIRPCLWQCHRQIEQYQAVGSLDPTLAEMSAVEMDREMVRITGRIHKLFARINQERLATQQAAKAEAMAQRQEEERVLAEQEAKRQAEETARNERLRAESEARAEAERWKAEAEAAKDEAERTRMEMERLAREKEELQRQASLKMPQPSPLPEAQSAKGPQLIQIPVTRGWLERKWGGWRKKEEPINVMGYQEKLAEGVAITMLQIPAGEFLMGSPQSEGGRYTNEGPQHKVSLQSYFLGQTPVTQAQWEVVARWGKVKIDLKPASARFSGANRPVECVNWLQAMEFCRRLSRRTGGRYVLPSEAQWEYACRAGTSTPFAFGETLTPEMASYSCYYTYGTGPRGLWREQTSEVGGFPANRWGLHDMHGNVWEWCADSWHDSYQGAPADGSVWSDDRDVIKLSRGGSWRNNPGDCRSACRFRGYLGECVNFAGFRVCCIPQDQFFTLKLFKSLPFGC